MLQSLLDRLFGRRPAVPPPLRAGARTAAARGTAAAAPRSGGLPNEVPIGARRPLVAATGGIAGFEFHLGEGTLRRLHSRADTGAATACTTSLLGAMRLCAQNGQVAYCELPAAWLLRAAGPDSLAPNMHLALAEDGTPQDVRALAERIRQWRASGAQIGWQPGRLPALAAQVVPDFLARWDAPTAAAAGPLAQVPWFAMDLPGIDALEAALAAGARLACCHLGSTTEPAEARPLTPQTQRLLMLLNELARDADNAAVVAAVKSDVSLSYRLLRQLNSAAVSPTNALGSIEQAVALLGRNELYRWVSVLLLQQAPPRPASPALQAMALARARLFELLAGAAGEPQPGALFTMGLASMLPLLLQTRLPEALASLHLHPLATRALMERQGPWRAYLTLAEVLEEGDLVEAAALAQPFGGLQAVMSLSARAWLFATQAGRSEAG